MDGPRRQEPVGRRVRRRAAGLCVWLLLTVAVPCRGRWYTYEDCRLIENDFNDGDSFHVRTKSDHRIFRLYFVDAPETDNTIPDRIAEQAAYWGIDEDRVLALGEAARRFTIDWLGDEPFTVYSKREDARGRSQRERHFALVVKDGKHLSRELVRRGLARIYGMYTHLPEGRTGRAFQEDLRAAERTARREGLGGWAKPGLAVRQRPELPDIAEQDVVLAHITAVYSLEEPRRLLGFAKRGTTVRVLRAETRQWVRIRFTVGTQTREGQCRRRDLGL